jgi:hypothetical protein
MKTQRGGGGKKYRSTLPSTSALYGSGWSLYRRLAKPQGHSGGVRKISPPPGFDSRTVQTVASHSLYRLRYPGPQDAPSRSLNNNSTVYIRWHYTVALNRKFRSWKDHIINTNLKTSLIFCTESCCFRSLGNVGCT